MKDYKKVEQIKKLLDAKEQRYFYQKHIVEQYKNTLISFMLNIPGEIKTSTKTIIFQRKFINKIKKILEQENIEIIFEDFRYKDTGDEYFAVVAGNASIVKKLMINLEEQNKECRLLDIDVFDEYMNQVSRNKLGYKGRKCLICDEEAKYCMRNKSHSIGEIIEETNKLLEVGNEKED